jgi:hypothetical protein
MSDRGLYTIAVGAALYLGSAMSFKRRWYVHRNELKNGTHHNVRLQAAHDAGDPMEFKILRALDGATPEALIAAEDAEMRAHPGRYALNVNKHIAAPPLAGKRHTAETKALMSAAHRGGAGCPGSVWQRTPEYRASVKARMTGRVMTPEHRANLSKAAKARYAKASV